ncbi:hypothetical protein [Flavobacterium covae]|uniref:hypothetical protein n=1 Tax=Flavobacterium covae TaxID=2906076 RepID=UPI0035E4606A
MDIEIIETIEIKKGFVSALLNTDLPIAIIKYRANYLNQLYWKYDVLGLETDSVKLDDISNKYNDYSFKLRNSTEYYGKDVNHKGIVSITLTRVQEQEFKQVLNQFKEIHNNKYGAVYENPNNSLLKAYKLYKLSNELN